ncbi:VanZ family protein [Nitrosospira lacus]|uniref:VanZ family protein n=1 Tax=Nitrosospira lacus TaxID=1288494 RepID=A0A1W6SL09_9PROT|nr:VanZ family protein [Nitrosospira lacus]ARO86472.1 VanZ family protein [Nitrosospira lacus]
MRILSVIAVLIAYGSLYPGNFSTPDAEAARQFLTDWRPFTSPGDLLGNIALFFPLGMAGILFASNRGNATIHGAWLLLFALVYSFALQLAQVWLPSRSAALADVLWNMTGMLSGMAVAHLIGKRLPGNAHPFDAALLVPLLVLILWLLTELLPLVPTLDWQKFKDALKPLLEFNISFPAATMHAAGALAAGSAFVALGRQPSTWLGSAIVIVWAGKVIIVNLILDASLFLGSLAGYAGCLMLSRLGRVKLFEAAFWLLLIAWSIAAITPFSPASGGTFNGIPFATMLRGSMETGARGLVQSLFIYTALLWLLQRTGMSIAKAVVGLVVWSCLIELTQMGLLGRTADVTEPILLLLIGWALSGMRKHAGPAKQQTETPASKPHPLMAVRTAASGKRTLALLTIGIGMCVAIGWLITRSPWVPYNVRELVYQGHPFRSLVLLAALLYWAMGFPILMAQWLARGKLYLLSFPPLALLHGLIAWLLLWSAVPSESIHDIVGSPVLNWPWEWEILGRFLALFSLWSVAATAGTVIAARRSFRSTNGAQSALLGWAIGACLLVPISYYIVVKAASTDNLVELMAGNGSVGAFLLIGLAMAGISFGGTKTTLALIPGTTGRTMAAAWVLASGALTYLAIYFGMEQVIVKYNQVFSALQFLLSSDRSHLAGPGELAVRYIALWSTLITAIVMVQYPLWSWAISDLRKAR